MISFLLCPHCGAQRQTEKALRAHLEKEHVRAGTEPPGALPAPGVPERAPPPDPKDGPVIRCYVRVSTDEQDTAAQRMRIKQACAMRGWANLVWYDEKESGAKRDRPELVRLQLDLQRGDVVCLLRADRLSRSLTDFVTVTKYIHDVGADLYCAEQPIDTTTPMGRAFWQILGVFAELERALIIQRTMDGLARARAAGRMSGRHRTGCGVARPCPTGVHGSNGLVILDKLPPIKRARTRRRLEAQGVILENAPPPSDARPEEKGSPKKEE